MRCPTMLTTGQQCILAAGHLSTCLPYCSHEPPPPARPLPVFAAQADLDPELHYKLGIEPLLQRLLANRPTCPMHPDVLVEPDPSQPLPDLSAMDAENGYRITVHWKCPHPDHEPDGPVDRYYRAAARGLSDAEARAEGWPDDDTVAPQGGTGWVSSE